MKPRKAACLRVESRETKYDSGKPISCRRLIFLEFDEEYHFEPFSWVKNFILCQELLLESNELNRRTDLTQHGYDSL